ncbi:hypothetical protein [Micrococcus terreus]|uniref:hypothetical protein n=1 Tax=Micrococcus terreus TaxID=574650 RepID=UPI003017B534
MEEPHHATDRVRQANRRLVWAVVFTVLCAGAAVLLMLQPWVSCDYEDTSAGCASTPLAAGLLMASVAATGAGLLVILGLVLAREFEVSPR